MNKVELITALTQSREKFLEALEGLSEEAMLEPGVVGEWSVKDVLAHISRWEAELVKLLWQARQGVKPTTQLNSQEPDEEINARWQQEDRSRPLERILQDFHGVRNQTIRRLEAFTEQELNDPQRFPWLEGKPLWRWVAGDSFKHEIEHLEQIITWRKQRGDWGEGT